MTRSDAINVHTALELIDRGRAQALDGRSGNATFCLTLGNRKVVVKVSAGRNACPERVAVLRGVDDVLADVPWYPRIVDIDLVGGVNLVVIRPFVEGRSFGYSPNDLAQACNALRRLLTLGQPVSVSPDDLADYATPWLDGREHEVRALGAMLGDEHTDFLDVVRERVGVLVDAARAITQDHSGFVHHGDLHGRNVMFNRDRLVGLIDWDDAGVSCRPIDAAKALWLLCRGGRDDFVLVPGAVRAFVTQVLPGSSTGEIIDLARLGSLWFLPRASHVDQLQRRDPALKEWYLGWVGRFWRRFDENMGAVNAATRPS